MEIWNSEVGSWLKSESVLVAWAKMGLPIGWTCKTPISVDHELPNM